MICTHHIMTLIGCWTRYICIYEEYSSFLSASSFDGKGFLVSINVTTRSNPPSPWFPYSGILVREWKQPLTLPAISSQFSFQILKPITTYENEFIFFLWSNCVLFNYLIRKYLYIKTWDIFSHSNYRYLYLIIMLLWYMV